MRKPNAAYGLDYWWMRRDLKHIWEHQWLNPELRNHVKQALDFINEHYSEDIQLYEALPEMEP